jgi:predicted dienelactone hydrolase
MWKGILLGAILVVAAGLLYFRYGQMPPPLPDGLESAALLERGPHRVASMDITLEDRSRAIAPHGDFPESPSRVLETRIWYPADMLSNPGMAALPHPLLVYSHGFMSQRSAAAYKAEHLVSRGYIVVAMDFPLTHGGAPGGPRIEDLVNQPADVSFVLDELLARNADPDSPFYRTIDEQRIGAFGLSLGGATTTLLAYHPRSADDRIGAAVSIAGPSFMLDRRFFAVRDVPFLLLAGDIDAVVPYEQNAAPILDKVDGALLVTLANASHTGFAGEARHMRWLSNPDRVACAVLTSRNDTPRDEAPRWYAAVGTPGDGVIATSPPPLCAMDPLPAAMNPIHQHRLTTMVVTAFFQSHFAEGAEARTYHDRLLRDVLPRELPEVTVEHSGPGRG